MQPSRPSKQITSMEYDFSDIDQMQTNSHTSQPASMHNLLNDTSQTPAFSQPLPWNPSHSSSGLPPLQPQSIHHPQKRPTPAPEKNPQPVSVLPIEPVEVDSHVVDQVGGGLAYADMCKERARETFKEVKKREHMANGDFHRTRRMRKGDASMNARDKYLRRLRMNQDSAAAARHAQEVYVHVLEEIVKTGEEEKKVVLTEVERLRQEMSHIRQENADLSNKLSHLEQQSNANISDPSALFDNADGRRYDAFQVAKLVDMLTTPERVSAQAQDRDFAQGRMGIQPSPAV